MRRSGKMRISAVILTAAMTMAMPGTAALAQSQEASSVITINEDEVPLSARVPDASGAVTFSGGGATIDASNTSNGYLMVKYGGGSQRIKVQITKNTKIGRAHV